MNFTSSSEINKVLPTSHLEFYLSSWVLALGCISLVTLFMFFFPFGTFFGFFLFSISMRPFVVVVIVKSL